MFDLGLDIHGEALWRCGGVGDIRDKLPHLQLVSGNRFYINIELTDMDSLIHIYFVANQISEALAAGQSYPTSCPQCQHSSFSVTVGNYQFGVGLKNGPNDGTKNGYAPLLDGEGEPRVSTDERANGGESMV